MVQFMRIETITSSRHSQMNIVFGQEIFAKVPGGSDSYLRTGAKVSQEP